MKHKLFIVSFNLLLIALGSHIASAVEIAAADFTNNGSAWSLTPGNPADLPILFEKDGDPTKVGFEHPNNEFAGLYNLTQQVFAPAGMSMTNIRLEALASGFSSWVMDGRVGFGLEEELYPLVYEYGMAASRGVDNENNGMVVVDYEIVLDSTGDPEFPATPSIWVAVEIVKALPQVSQHADVSQIKIYADLTPIPAGDLNGDLNVDGRDFLYWQRGLTNPPLDPTALAEWQTNYPSSLTSSLGAVPEPSGLVLGAFLASSLLALRRGKKQ